jgi:predicted dehydrogenase
MRESSRRDFIRAAGHGILAAGAMNMLTSTALAQDQPAAPSKKLGWAIVGLGQLALTQVMPAFKNCQRSRPTALVSGHPDKANKVAGDYGVDPKRIYNYENYDKLKDDPDVDVVYNILPDSMHAEYTIRALRAGKHVLCEKPMAMNVKECEQMCAAAKETGKKLMVAYRLQYEPFTMAARDAARGGKLGPIRFFESVNYQNIRAPNIRLSRSTGTGPLGDLGVYCINAARYVLGEEPVEATGMDHQPKDDERFREVPARVTFQLRFPSGAIASCGCGFDGQPARRFRAVCENGAIEMDNAFGYGGQKLRIIEGRQSGEPQLQPVNHFVREMDYFSECVTNDRQPETPGEEGLADMKVIAAVEEAARSGKLTRV